MASIEEAAASSRDRLDQVRRWYGMTPERYEEVYRVATSLDPREMTTWLRTQPDSESRAHMFEVMDAAYGETDHTPIIMRDQLIEELIAGQAETQDQEH